MKIEKKSEIGIKGEQIACKYLIGKEYLILEKNWRSRHKEIDIIAQKNGILIIVEVKTRSSSFFERPQDAVTIKKQRFLIVATNEYVSLTDFSGEIQFDIVSILLENNKVEIEHIENAFYPICK